MTNSCTETYRKCTAARTARVEQVIAARQPGETEKQLAERAGVSRSTVQRLIRLQKASREADCNKTESSNPRALKVITVEEIAALKAVADDEIKEWLSIYGRWKKRKKDQAYKLFLNLNAIGDL